MEPAREAALRILDYWDIPRGRMPRAPHSQDEVLVAQTLLAMIDAGPVPLTHPELEEALKHVTAFDDCQMGMLEWAKVHRLVVAARQYVWMLKRVESAHAALAKASA